jgi:glucose/arabinose dehydrogenase
MVEQAFSLVMASRAYMHRVAVSALLLASLLLAGCWSPSPDDEGPADDAGATLIDPSDLLVPPDASADEVLQRDNWVGELTQAVAVPGADGDLLVLERRGYVVYYEAGTGETTTVLDVTDRVDPEASRERGLKALAFHPDFEDNGMVFVVYDGTYDPDESRDGYGHLVRYFAEGDMREGLVEGDIVLEIEWDENWFHNMAGIAFGPDGMLYVGLGDGGERMRAQDPGHLWGSILRIDVDDAEGYSVPEDNPFVGDEDKRGEVYLYGLRNPWRFAFHPETHDLFIANTGADIEESVYLFPADQQASRNHGWPHLDGTQPFRDYGEPEEEINMPIVTYPNGGGKCGIIGGMFYQGEAFAELVNTFVFADHCESRLKYLVETEDGWQIVEWILTDQTFINSVDAGHDGEILVSDRPGGLKRIVPGDE